MTHLGSDIVVAWRRLRATPGFFAGALLTLAIGLGASVSVFTLVSGVLLKPLPFEAPERLMMVTREGDVGLLDGVDWRRESKTLAEIGLHLRSWDLDLTGAGDPARLNAGVAEPEYFRVLRMPMLRGRGLIPEDNVVGGPKSAVISEALWKRRFGGDPGVIGRTITLSDIPATIVGVAPAEFDFLRNGNDVWVTPALATPWAFPQRGTNNFDAIARLTDGATPQQALDEMVAISRRLETQYPDTNRGKIVQPIPMLDFMIGGARRALLVLMTAVALVVLIASVNLATALLARSAARKEEFAVRIALGAPRSAIARLVLAEGLLLAGLAGALGLAVALVSREALVSLAEASLPRAWAVDANPMIAVFAMGASLLAGAVMGLIPAWQVMRGDVAAYVRTARGARGRGRLSGPLVAVEVALAVVLLVGAGLLLKTFDRLQNVPLGFDPDRLLIASVSLPDSRYAEKIDAQNRVFSGALERVRTTPGVDGAAYVITPPLEPRGGIGGGVQFLNPPANLPERVGARARMVMGDYFAVLKIPVVSGRAFGTEDDAASPKVAIINQTFAREFWGDRSPIGDRIAWRGWTPEPVWMEIVGVVSDIKGVTLAAADSRTIYVPYVQRTTGWQRWGNIVARTSMPQAAYEKTVLSAVAAEDPLVPVGRVESIDDRRTQMLGPSRLNASAVGFFGFVALLVALQGIHALVAQSAAERRREIGLRMALGATSSAVLRDMVGRSARLVGIGLAAGAVLALGLGRFASALLFETAPADPSVLAGALGLLGVLALGASFVPARRAALASPATTLRED